MMHPGGLPWPDPHEADGAPPERPAPLGLMLPHDLPAELALGPDEEALVRTTLTAFLHALDDSDPAQRLARIRTLLAAIPDDGAPAQIRTTAIPAGRAEVEDFDRYFGIRRLRATAPALSLLRGLLQTSAGVLALAARGPDLPRRTLDRQVAGFAAYARLLGRVCGLGGLP